MGPGGSVPRVQSIRHCSVDVDTGCFPKFAIDLWLCTGCPWGCLNCLTIRSPYINKQTNNFCVSNFTFFSSSSLHMVHIMRRQLKQITAPTNSTKVKRDGPTPLLVTYSCFRSVVFLACLAASWSPNTRTRSQLFNRQKLQPTRPP
jgi:hypothetical protein